MHHLDWLVLAALVLGIQSSTGRADETPVSKYWVYFGTYTGDKSKGIYRSELDVATGKLSEPVLAGELANPSFLAIHPNRRFLYAVGELPDFRGKKGGAVSAFAVDSATGQLKLLNQESSAGSGPCHINIDKTGKFALVANYGGGSAAMLPVQADGSLQPATGFVQHKGSSVNKARQEAPHAHSINVDPGNQFAFVADLGLDKVLVYRMDRDKGKLEANDPPAVDLKPGAGPRHFAFHPSGKFAYVINELNSTITAMTYQAERGVLTPVQSISTLPEGFKGNTSTAEVLVHPSGKFVYGSNRGHDSIAIFQVDPDTGKLTAAGHQGTNIKVPRNFAIEPTGKYVLVANQGASTVCVFAVHPRTGELSPVGEPVAVPTPVCVRFIPAP